MRSLGKSALVLVEFELQRFELINWVVLGDINHVKKASASLDVTKESDSKTLMENMAY